MAGPAEASLGGVLGDYRSALLWAAGASGVLNVLMLSGSFFMLLVYDSVLPSRSVASLVGLVVVVITLYLFQGVLDVLRSRLLIQLGAAIDAKLSPQIYALAVRGGEHGAGEGLQSLRDLDQLRNFVSGQGLPAFFDLPWILLYLGLCFAFHWLIGLTALVGAVLLVILALVGDRATRASVRTATMRGAVRTEMAEANRQNADLITALGMRRRLAKTWAQVNTDYRQTQDEASAVGGTLRSITRVTRIALQSIVLAVGAWLVLENLATAGVIIASSILTSRALAPIEQVTGDWRSVIASRQAWTRLAARLRAEAPESEPLPLPAPASSLSVERVSVATPAGRIALVDVTFALKAGDALGVIGPSAVGKSILARVLVGVSRPVRGDVRLDGASLEQWDDERLGRHIGYLPQQVQLLAGTVGQNISRFDGSSKADQIIAAAKMANVHDLILRLADGYDTRVGPGGSGLSAGQAQRIALARAFFRVPFFIVLDEPNSNLDADGEDALHSAILSARRAGSIVVIIAHRPSILAATNKILVLGQGKVQAFGDRDAVLSKVKAPARSPDNDGAVQISTS